MGGNDWRGRSERSITDVENGLEITEGCCVQSWNGGFHKKGRRGLERKEVSETTNSLNKWTINIQRWC